MDKMTKDALKKWILFGLWLPVYYLMLRLFGVKKERKYY